MGKVSLDQIIPVLQLIQSKIKKNGVSNPTRWLQGFFETRLLSLFFNIKNAREVDLELFEQAVGLPASPLEVDVVVRYETGIVNLPIGGWRVENEKIPGLKKDRVRKERLELIHMFPSGLAGYDPGYIDVFEEAEKSKAYGCVFCASALANDKHVIIPKSFQKYYLVFPGVIFPTESQGECVAVLNFSQSSKQWKLDYFPVNPYFPRAGINHLIKSNLKHCCLVRVVSDGWYEVGGEFQLRAKE